VRAQKDHDVSDLWLASTVERNDRQHFRFGTG